MASKKIMPAMTSAREGRERALVQNQREEEVVGFPDPAFTGAPSRRPPAAEPRTEKEIEDEL
jgi:hypothetical protein